MSADVQLPETELRAWWQAVDARRDVRGAPAVAKEMESWLARRAADGRVPVPRHVAFTWAESLRGMAERDPRGTAAGAHLSFRQIADDLRAHLGGTPPPTRPAVAPAPSQAPAPEPSRASPPPVVYRPSGQPAAFQGGARFVRPEEVADAVRALLRDAREEVLVISPWALGLDTLADELARLPPGVRVRVVSRRAERQDAAYQRALDHLRRRGAEVAFSQHLQTRMVVADRRRLCLGAASLAAPQSAPTREAAVAIDDADAARDARDHFERVFREGERLP